MASLSALKKCATARKYAIFGYIREQNKLLSLPVIPKVIDYLCLAYYAPDLFSKKNMDLNEIEISMDQTTITYIKRDYDKNRTIYGTNWIDATSKETHEWKFKVNQCNSWISIGIASKDNNMNVNFSNSLNAPNYALIIEKSYYELQSHGSTIKQYRRPGSIQVIMKLNMEKGILYFGFCGNEDTLHELKIARHHSINADQIAMYKAYEKIFGVEEAARQVGLDPAETKKPLTY